MAVRKEQVLAGLALLLGLLWARSYFGEPATGKRFAPGKREYAAKPVGASPLVSEAAPAMVRRDFCTEPSETQPLPPRQLEFPARPPLTLAPLPLDPGPDLRHAYALRVDGAPLTGAVAQSGDAAPAEAATPGPAEGSAPAAAPAPAAQGGDDNAALTYDRLWRAGLKDPEYGILEADGKDLFALEERPDFDGVQMRMRIYERSKQRLGNVRTFGEGSDRIEKIRLADSLRNEIMRRERRLKNDVSSVPQRRELIVWLLGKAREAAWVYEKARQHAETCFQLTNGDLDSLRLQQLVQRARGDLAGELAMLEALPTTGAEGAFRFEGLGLLKAGLGLFVEAESDLRQASTLQPSDARPQASLAEFLRQRGRTTEALDVARRIERTINGVQDPADKARCGRVLVACLLAAGETAAAREAMAFVAANGPQPYVEGCVQYAAGDAATAAASFRSAGGTADSGAASYAQAASLGAMGKSQEAHDLLLRVYDQEPLWRHRAAAALAWVFLRHGQHDAALGWIDRALEADPQDAFSYYLRGRTLRLAGQLDAARDALAAALRLRDDFVHAIAEMAAVQAARAVERGDVEAAIAARRYSDRAVDLVAAPSPELCELQGLNAFLAADPVAAKDAFARARDLVSDEKLKWYGKGAIAVVDYSRGNVEEAQAALQRMTLDLGRDDPMATWAKARLDDIDDHAQKETLGDGFERELLGEIWLVDSDGTFEPRIEGGRLCWDGSLRGKEQVWAERGGVIQKGRNFLAVGVTMHVGAKQSTTDSFVGLALVMPRGNGGVEFMAQLGLKDGHAFVRVDDGQENGAANIDQKQLGVTAFDLKQPQQLELRVVPIGDPQAKKLELQASWNGDVVYRRELRTLSGNTTAALKTWLLVRSRKGDTTHVAFDDYRLERRKER